MPAFTHFFVELAFFDRFYGAAVFASAAIYAKVGIDFVNPLCFVESNCFYGTGAFASAACYAFIRDNVCHSVTSKID